MIHQQRIAKFLVMQSTTLLMLSLTTLGIAAEPTSPETTSPFVGNWAIKLPDGSAGWLKLSIINDKPTGELWSVGSPKTLSDLAINGNQIQFLRKCAVGPPEYEGGPPSGKRIDCVHKGVLNGDTMALVIEQPLPDGTIQELPFSGKRLPAIGRAPDLTNIELGEPIELFNGRNLDGWHLTNPKQINGWKAINGELVNTTPKLDFQPYSRYGNLQTDQEFTDFHLSIEFNVPSGGNSGIYLRGMYEAQVVDRDSKMQGIQGVGAIFGRIAPSSNAGRPGGEWQKYEITLVDRHATVILNGTKVIDNQPIDGCTNGALDADETKPGALYLQGDHTAVRYRNIVLRPIFKPWQANPELVKSTSDRRPEFNYDESKVPDFTLPDPLVSTDGETVVTPTQWNEVRRPELLELFRNHVYGRRPNTKYSVTFEQTAENPHALNGAATGRQMNAVITIDNRSFSFPFVVFVPNHIETPAPAVIHINNRYFTSMEKAIDEHDPFWPVKSIIDRGYATASFHTSDVDPDKKDGYANGIRSFFANGAPPQDNAWRSLSAWGWGASRVLDYLETLDVIDSTRVAVSGHSRGGKTSLWAASEDSRFAIAYSNDSGCGGAALSRRAYGETVARITSSFPHWFCKPFSSYAGREADLPVDQHELIALIAPRGVYVASADQDLWADPKGEYQSVVASAPVFRLLEKTSIDMTQMPALGQQRIVGQTGYHIRAGGHGLGDDDWNWFLNFADSIFK
ncbi:MAG: DUF1080 domain-containing protein [Planctomycetales bacterium]|nr:DUF1080 domain-containing protein [Planctomycetales bacterium]